MILNQYVTVITSVCTAEKTYICPNDFLILGVWEHVVKQSVVLEQAEDIDITIVIQSVVLEQAEDIDTKHSVSNITCAIALENAWSFILQCNSNISPLVASLKSSYRLAIVKQTNKQMKNNDPLLFPHLKTWHFSPSQGHFHFTPSSSYPLWVYTHHHFLFSLCQTLAVPMSWPLSQQ